MRGRPLVSELHRVSEPKRGDISKRTPLLLIRLAPRATFPTWGRLAILHRATKGFPSGGSCRRRRLMRGRPLISELHRVSEPKRGGISKRTPLLLIRLAPRATFPTWGRLGQCKPDPQGEGFEAAMRRRMSSQTPEKFCAISKLVYRTTSSPRLRRYWSRSRSLACPAGS